MDKPTQTTYYKTRGRNHLTEEEIKLLKCIGNEIRYKILKSLEEEEKCVCEIEEELDREQSLISHHLQSLKECGLIQKRQEGRRVMYNLTNPSISDFLKKVEKLSQDFC